MATRGAVGRELTEQIERVRKREGRSVAWLAERAGFSYSTFRRRLEVAPDNFSIRELHRIADALGVAIEALILVTEDEPAAVAS